MRLDSIKMHGATVKKVPSLCVVELPVTLNFIQLLLIHNNTLWQIFVAGNNNTYFGPGFRVKCSTKRSQISGPLTYVLPN